MFKLELEECKEHDFCEQIGRSDKSYEQFSRITSVTFYHTCRVSYFQKQVNQYADRLTIVAQTIFGLKALSMSAKGI